MKQSMNFEFIRPHMPQAADLCWCAENVLHIDPGSSATRLRAVCEVIVNEIYEQETLTKYDRDNLNDLMRKPSFQDCIDKSLYYKLDQLRLSGNKTAHGAEGQLREAAMCLGITHNVLIYMAVHYFNVSASSIASFKDVPKPELQAKQEVEELKQKLKAAEEKALKESKEKEQERNKRIKAEVDAAQRAKAKVKSQHTAQSLEWNETKTRELLIDSMLADAGWDVTNDQQVGIEVKCISPIDNRNLRVDYVLWGDDHLPLAIVEAKRASDQDLAAGREQAREYAAALEAQTGQRPVIFVTNGYETEIWNDAEDNSARDIYGFYDKESLEYLIFQRTYKTKELEKNNPNPNIAGRDYQIEAIKAVANRFQPDHAEHGRKALIVQATGTGKTRVAIAISDLLTEQKWAKRILFLCDRKELRRQANEAFKEHLPSEARCVVGETSKIDDTARIYIATYPGMMGRYASLNVGFFDLIIADESHRSIYNKYRELFEYFDAYQIGLTATPVKFVERHTFSLFGCNETEPTFNFGFAEAVKRQYLVPYRVKDHTTEFLREGICYSDLSDEQKAQLEEDLGEEEAKNTRIAGKDIGRKIQSEDTECLILENLMDNGVKDPHGTIGKTIIFAQRHEHAQSLAKTFKKLYPQHGDRVCKVIHNKVRNAEALITEFKKPDNDFRIAISVDMLDTGIDVPEVVNLVFAKPVRSWVKFHQMIGRGTRLCLNLFGQGDESDPADPNHKQEFWIFDHYGNFAYFEEEYVELDQGTSKSSLQQLFESRTVLARQAQLKGLEASTTFDMAIALLKEDINDLPQKAVAVKRGLRSVHQLQQTDMLATFNSTAQKLLETTIAPLMGQRVMHDKAAINFDRQMVELQLACLAKAQTLHDLKNALIKELDDLAVNITHVRNKEGVINRVKSQDFWLNVTVADLEDARLQLRDIMKYKKKGAGVGYDMLKTATKENKHEVREFERKVTITDEAQAMLYREKTARILKQMLNTNPILTNVYEGKQVKPEELDSLVSTILVQHPGVDIKVLNEFYGRTAEELQTTLQNLIGLDPSYVRSHFAGFLQAHPELTHKQVQFLNMLQHFIAEHGSITQGQLFQTPFNSIDPNGIAGVFEQNDIQDLVTLLSPFVNEPAASTVN
ncbi:DEAD/DEAH box helicase family protein [Neiella marina]|uniref:DEAD/DEAH box helicase family protein n=1 Tax=Neiella holothuriorum TaxID=2870530 RepID=A0ABS7ED98_9GAMM|nr:DEAD/DEAH box helicase family protein [Neiella holothuriorum]MBW8190291.1 DEAD/DEAH box helicase family protein [Neiella holothuriorum]